MLKNRHSEFLLLLLSHFTVRAQDACNPPYARVHLADGNRSGCCRAGAGGSDTGDFLAESTTLLSECQQICTSNPTCVAYEWQPRYTLENCEIHTTPITTVSRVPASCEHIECWRKRVCTQQPTSNPTTKIPTTMQPTPYPSTTAPTLAPSLFPSTSTTTPIILFPTSAPTTTPTLNDSAIIQTLSPLGSENPTTALLLSTKQINALSDASLRSTATSETYTTPGATIANNVAHQDSSKSNTLSISVMLGATSCLLVVCLGLLIKRRRKSTKFFRNEEAFPSTFSPSDPAAVCITSNPMYVKCINCSVSEPDMHHTHRRVLTDAHYHGSTPLIHCYVKLWFMVQRERCVGDGHWWVSGVGVV